MSCTVLAWRFPVKQMGHSVPNNCLVLEVSQSELKFSEVPQEIRCLIPINFQGIPVSLYNPRHRARPYSILFHT